MLTEKEAFDLYAAGMRVYKDDLPRTPRTDEAQQIPIVEVHRQAAARQIEFGDIAPTKGTLRYEQPAANPQEENFLSWANETGKVIFDVDRNILWTVKPGGDLNKKDDRVFLPGKRFCDLTGVDYQGGIQRLFESRMEISLRNWEKSFPSKEAMVTRFSAEMAKAKANMESRPPEVPAEAPHILTVGDILKAEGVRDEQIEIVNRAKATLEKRVAQATGKFLDGVDQVMRIVPDNMIAHAIIAVAESATIVYSPLDALTILSGVRDILGGRALPNDESHTRLLAGVRLTDQNAAYLRGVLKIIGAATPIIPTYWVNEALKQTMPIAGLDKSKK